ncbi:MAG: aminoglycoside 6-adenylyltransferase, partial [Bacilli bacterium]|nr:aminoglycoside 6-adenylyltransferase [Bacilli bacterium]
MKLKQIVEILAKSIKECHLVEALYVKGSIARNEEDEYSNINLVCVVDEANILTFQEKKLDLLRSYQEILYTHEAPTLPLVIIYEDGTEVDLTIVDSIALHETDSFQILFDPKGLLKHLIVQPLQLTDEDVRLLIDRFSYQMFEFAKAYCRGDGLYALHLAYALHQAYTQLYRYVKQPIYSKIPSKGFLMSLNHEDKEAFLATSRLLRYDTSLQATQKIVEAMQQVIVNLPLMITIAINYVFFEYGKRKI